MANQIANRVGLARTRRPLHQQSVIRVDPLSDLALLFIGGKREVDLRIACFDRRPCIRRLPFAIPTAFLFYDLDEPSDALGDGLGLPHLLEDSVIEIDIRTPRSLAQNQGGAKMQGRPFLDPLGPAQAAHI